MQRRKSEHQACSGLVVVLAMAALPSPGLSQAASIEAAGVAVTAEGTTATLLLAVDDDDDDEDGVADNEQQHNVPKDELLELRLTPTAPDSALLLNVRGGLRIVHNGKPLRLPATLAPEQLPAVVFLQARRPSSRGKPPAVLLSAAGREQRVPVRAVALRVLDGFNRLLSAGDALSVSHRVTNGGSLPRSFDYHRSSGDPQNIRVELADATAKGMRLFTTLQSLDDASGRVRDELTLELSRPRAGEPFRSRFVRLVGDDVDRNAHGVGGQVLRVALRDRVRVVYQLPQGKLTQDFRVGLPGRAESPLAARIARVHAVVLRAYPGGPPVIGVDDLSALRIVREEVAIANGIWLQCGITFGAPEEAAIAIVDPPPPTLLTVANGNGLPAAGGGELHFRIDDRVIGPVETRRGDIPQTTALNLAQALREAGFDTTVTVNPSTVFGAGDSADVLVRRRDGTFVTMEAIPGVPLSSDARQTLHIGGVELGDGLEEFNNMTAQSGTLEERTLLKALGDDDPSTIDLFVVNRFSHGTRQGEAFIEASSGPLVNAVVLDRNGLRQRQTAWTMAHEMGHVLLNQPLHPDNLGPDRPSLLMDSDNNRGTVNGPKRLSPADCQRVRYESGVQALPALLQPY